MYRIHGGNIGLKKKADVLIGTNGDDVLDGDDGRDVILGRKGNDFLDGGAGFDIVLAGRGDDVANYALSENQGTRDYYDGGRGFDTLQLTLSSAELQLPAVQADIAAFQAFLDGACHGHVRSFHFDAFGLTVRNFEALEIRLVGGNAAPVALDDLFPGNEDAPLSGNVLANDTDAEGSTLSAALVSGPAHGTLLLDADGSFSYTPEADFNGEDSFTYLVNDGELDSNIATVTLAVAPVNDAPVAADDAFAGQEDTPLSGNVLANDTDAEGSTLSAAPVSGPAHGTLVLDADGSFTYTPDLDYFGDDFFTYRASDGPSQSNLATVNLTINAAPVAVDDAIGGSGEPVRVAVVGGRDSTYLDAVAQLNDSTAFDIDADPIPVTLYDTKTEWTTALAEYDVVVIGGNGQIDDFGNLSIFPALRSFVGEDGGGVVSTGWFARALANLSPSAQADADFVTPVSTAGHGFVAAGSTVTANVNESSHPIAKGISSYVTPELHETAIALDAGLIPLATASNGGAAIAYDVAGNGLTAYLGGIYMAAPIFIPDQTRSGDLDKLFEQAVVWAAGPDTATDEDTPLTIAPSLLLGNDTDAEGGSPTLVAVHSSTLGASLLIDGSGNIVYDPTSAPALQALNPGEFATDYFDYEISDGNGGFDTGTVGITVSGLADVTSGTTGTQELTLALGAPDADILL